MSENSIVWMVAFTIVCVVIAAFDSGHTRSGYGPQSPYHPGMTSMDMGSPPVGYQPHGGHYAHRP